MKLKLLVAGIVSMIILSGHSVSIKPNVLLIMVDDLNTHLGSYGNTIVQSPAIDAIASTGTLFEKSYSQSAVCGVSRASILTGYRPDVTGITKFHIYMRELYPGIITLPQLFKNNGYFTIGSGKVFGGSNVSFLDKVDQKSWSRFLKITGGKYANATGNPVLEKSDSPSSKYYDGMLTQQLLSQIKRIGDSGKPFFMTAGFRKPHLPFAVPKEFWDLYDREDLELPDFRGIASNDEEFTYNFGKEFSNYGGIDAESFSDDEVLKDLIHGYYACISFVDSQIALLINQLKQNDLYENTIVVVIGDHGFHLGDHSMWGKHTNFEEANRTPMIIKLPGQTESKRILDPVELVDLYPTLAELAELDYSDDLDGGSLVSYLTSGQGSSDYAISQYPRDGAIGYTIRSERFRLVKWIKNGSSIHGQLFDYLFDPDERHNQIDVDSLSGHKEILEEELDKYILSTKRLVQSLAIQFESSDQGLMLTSNKILDEVEIVNFIGKVLHVSEPASKQMLIRNKNRGFIILKVRSGKETITRKILL